MTRRIISWSALFLAALFGVPGPGTILAEGPAALPPPLRNLTAFVCTQKPEACAGVLYVYLRPIDFAFQVK